MPAIHRYMTAIRVLYECYKYRIHSLLKALKYMLTYKYSVSSFTTCEQCKCIAPHFVRCLHLRSIFRTTFEKLKSKTNQQP